MKSVIALVSVLALGSAAQGVVNPFTEDFAADAASWRQADGTTPMVWSSSGGPDGGAYTSATYNYVASSAGDMPAIIRAHDSYDSSGDAFVGDWLAAGVTTLSFDVRHDAGVALSFFGRAATSANFPGAGALEFTPVPSGVWTTITFPVEPGSWFLEGPIAFSDVFGSVGNLQFGASPGSLAGVDQDVTFDIDKVTITPAPGVLALAGVGGLVGLRRRR